MTGFQSRMWIEIWHGIWNPERVWNFDLIPDGKPEFLAGQSHPGWYSPLMKGLWIYCQVCAKKINMKYPFRGSRWNEHAKAVSHLEAKAKEEHQEAGESSPLE